MSSLISVIMPAYNAEETIKEAIISILNQTYTNFELIICDDGSTDRTIKEIKSIKDKRIRLIINEKNIGNLFTTNKLFSACEGEYIALQDADDFSFKDRLEKQMNALKKEDVDLVGTQAGILFNSDVINVTSYPKINAEILDSMLKSSRVPIVWGSVLFKKDIYETIGGFDVLFDRIGAADYNWLQRATFRYKLYNVQECLYLYRQHADSFTKSMDAQSIPRLYSENIAFDIFLFCEEQGCYDSNKVQSFFKSRVSYYEDIALKDEKIFAGKIYSDLFFGKIGLISYTSKIVKLKTSAKVKAKFISQGLCIYLLGVKKTEKLKSFMRK